MECSGGEGEGDFENDGMARSEASSIGFPICRKSLSKCSGISGLGGTSAESIGICRPLALGRRALLALEEGRE